MSKEKHLPTWWDQNDWWVKNLLATTPLFFLFFGGIGYILFVTQNDYFRLRQLYVTLFFLFFIGIASLIFKFYLEPNAAGRPAPKNIKKSGERPFKR